MKAMAASEIEFTVTLGNNVIGGDAIELNQIPSASAGTAGVNLNPADADSRRG